VSQQNTIPTRNLAIGLLTGFGIIIVFIIAVLLISKLGVQEGVESASLVYERVKPVGQVKVEGAIQVAQAPEIDASQSESPASPTETAESTSPEAKGEQVYNTACFACHGMGIAGAPKLGEQAIWAPRIAKGMETLFLHALQGFQGETGVMPAKGAQMQLPDEDVKAAVTYMVSQAQ